MHLRYISRGALVMFAGGDPWKLTPPSKAAGQPNDVPAPLPPTEFGPVTDPPSVPPLSGGATQF